MNSDRVAPAAGPVRTAETADLTVVGGAGHIGIPLVLAFAEAGLTVNVNDLNRTALDALAGGKLPFIEYGAEALLAKALADERLIFTDSPGKISRKSPVVVTIGTPVDEFLNPLQKVVQECVDGLLPHMIDGQLLVLRSTVFPGTTAWLGEHLRRQGRDIHLAYCPERVVQGHGVKELREVPQIVSGITPEAEQKAGALFRLIAPELVSVTPIEAEFAKLFNNAYRYIEFAAANQFYMIAKSAGVDYQNVLRAMRHNYPRAKHMPGPGYAAGPCLFKDTMQLAAFARNQFALGQAAMLVNEGLVLDVVDHVRRNHDLSTMTVGLLGMAFKAEIDDTRASLSYKFKKLLKGLAREVLTTDPYVATDPDLKPLEEVIDRSDLLILCAPHAAYRRADFKGKIVVDVWGLVGGAGVIR